MNWAACSSLSYAFNFSLNGITLIKHSAEVKIFFYMPNVAIRKLVAQTKRKNTKVHHLSENMLVALQFSNLRLWHLMLFVFIRVAFSLGSKVFDSTNTQYSSVDMKMNSMYQMSICIPFPHTLYSLCGPCPCCLLIAVSFLVM